MGRNGAGPQWPTSAVNCKSGDRCTVSGSSTNPEQWHCSCPCFSTCCSLHASRSFSSFPTGTFFERLWELLVIPGPVRATFCATGAFFQDKTGNGSVHYLPPHRQSWSIGNSQVVQGFYLMSFSGVILWHARFLITLAQVVRQQEPWWLYVKAGGGIQITPSSFTAERLELLGSVQCLPVWPVQCHQGPVGSPRASSGPGGYFICPSFSDWQSSPGERERERSSAVVFLPTREDSQLLNASPHGACLLVA